MRRHLRVVPWVRAVEREPCQGRRVRPSRVRGEWRYVPDSLGEALRAYFWRHPMAEAALVALALTAAGFLMLWWLLV